MLKVLDDIDKEKWGDFVRNHPQGNIFQTPEMADVYRKTRNYEPFFLSVINNSSGEIESLLLGVIIKRSGIFQQYASRSIIQGGPLFKNNKSSLEPLLNNYNRLIKERVLYTQIRNMWNTSSIMVELNNTGFKLKDHLNFIINLNSTETELWSNLSKSRKYGINKAKRIGVEIEELIDEKMIETTVYPILKETYNRAKLPIADISLFESALKLLKNKNMIKIFTAKYKNKYLGALALLTFKNVIYDWYAGSSRNFSKYYPNDILMWHAILWGYKNSYQQFDLGGAGNPQESYGVRDFKKQFGGARVNFGRYQQVYAPIKMKIMENGFRIFKKLKT